MGLFDFLRFRRRADHDPTTSWISDPSRELTIDCGTGTLSGVGLGQPFDQLAWLGPADSHSELDPYASRANRVVGYRFKQHGLVVREQRQKFHSVQVEFSAHAGGVPFTGRCKHNGASLQVSSQTTAADVIDLFGTPGNRGIHYGNNDFMDLTLSYDFDCTVTFIFPLPDCCTEEEEAANTHDLRMIILNES